MSKNLKKNKIYIKKNKNKTKIK